MTSVKNVLVMLTLSVVMVYGATCAISAESEVKQSAPRGPADMSKGKKGSYDPDQRLELMTRNMKLTPEQQAKIKPILAEEYSHLEALKGNDTYNRDERRSKLQELNQTTYDKIRPILTPDQQKRHEDVKQVIKERRSNARGSRPISETTKGPALNDPDRRLKNLKNDLGLTEEQQAKIKPMLVEEFSQIDKLKGNDTINREQRRVKLQELGKETYEKMKQVLTPEQIQKYEQIRQKISDRRALKKSAPPAPPNRE
jgi:Spy/CpxP family protein refolding chaperone